MSNELFRVRVGDDGRSLFESEFYGEAFDRAEEISKTGSLRQAYIRYQGENVALLRDGEVIWERS